MYQMLLVFDLRSRGSSHVPFNQGYLQVLHCAIPNEQIAFFGDEDHCAELLERNELPGIEFEKGPSYPALSSVDEMRPWVSLAPAIRCVYRIREIARRRNAKFVAILDITPSMVWALRRLWKPGDPRIDLILHGGLAEIVRWRSRNPILRQFDWFSQCSSPAPANVRFVALENSITNNLVRLCEERRKDTLTLEHPVPQHEVFNKRPELSSQLDIGFLGNTALAKGFSDFLEAARRVPRHRYHAFGRAVGPLASDIGSLLLTPPGQSLPRPVYLDRVRSLDMVVLPLALPAYDWTASGSLVDCITNLIPVIVTRTTITEDIFNRFGPCGVIIDAASDLPELLARVDSNWLGKNRALFVANLAKARQARMPEVLAKTYPRLEGD